MESLKIPNHVGIIVDGNGRWAKEKNMPRSYGHKHGADNIEKIANYIFSKGVNYLSLFVFSTENFKRSNDEVSFLMELFKKEFIKYAESFNKNNVKIVFSGIDDNLPFEVINSVSKMTEMTKNNNGGVINFCLNYGGRREIIDAAKKISILYKNGEINLDDINEFSFKDYLYQNLPDIDLLIRTSGEMRISNFMLYNLAYSEFYFPNVYFPDFKEDDFDDALLVYNKRDRRFGGINYEKKSN